ncbi:MAG: hypothetical protein J0M28_13875 [Thauera sp.]|nr:hypothetical protein [Thauera sp.]
MRVAISGDLAANNGDAQLAAAVGGQGLIYQLDFIVSEEVKRGELVVLKLDQPTYALGGIYAVYPPDRRQPARLRVMIDCLATHFASPPLSGSAAESICSAALRFASDSAPCNDPLMTFGRDRPPWGVRGLSPGRRGHCTVSARLGS